MISNKEGSKYYSFLLEWPNLNESIAWHQESSIFDSLLVAKGLNITYQRGNFNFFGGLHDALSGSYLLNGDSSGEWWYYAIGTISEEYKPLFPGPRKDRNGHFTSYADLWIEIGSADKLSLILPKICTFREICFNINQLMLYVIIIIED